MYIKFNRLKKRRTWLLPVLIMMLVLTILLMFTGKSLGRYFYPFPYQDLVRQEARANSVDPYFAAALMLAESKFSPAAESARGARGIMQIMPETGKWAAKQMGITNFNVDLLFVPRINIKIGCWYLADLHREFKGNRCLVLAAYNAGRGNVKQWLAQKTWDGTLADVQQIPFPETRKYVVTVLKNYERYKFLYSNK